MIDLYIYFLLAILFYNILNKINPNSENLKYNKDYCLIVGYKGVIKKKNIIVDMRITPHLLVCGLSGSGKTKCIEYAIKDKRVIILNAFKNDFKSINSPKINGENNIINVLMNCCKQYQKTPLYIVIDELLVLCNNKKINKCILDSVAYSENGFVEAIEGLASEIEKCAVMGSRGRQFILDNLTREVGTQKYVDLFRQLL